MDYTVFGLEEAWVPVADFEGWYEVSSHGRVRSLDRWDGMNRRLLGRLLKPRKVSPAGHVGVQLYMSGTGGNRALHVLVLETFVGPRPPGLYGCHRDDVKTNNAIWNLYWGTHEENMEDAKRNGSFRQAKRTHCPRNHEYTEENTYRWKNKRYCRECNRQYHRNGGVWPE